MILKVKFLNSLQRIVAWAVAVKLLPAEWPLLMKVGIGSGDVPEPMLTKTYVASGVTRAQQVNAM